VIEGVITKPYGTASFGVAGNGTLAYIQGTGQTSDKRAVVWVDRDGREESLGLPPRAYAYARASPDASEIALDVREDQNDIWIWNTARRIMTRLTFDPGLNRGPVWTPDGTRVAFALEREGTQTVFWQRSDGSSPAEPLSRNLKEEMFPNSFSPDGRRLVFNRASTPQDLGILRLDDPEHPEIVLNSPFEELNGVVSPDGRWLAYESNESGRQEIYVRPFPEVKSARWQVSTEGGTRPAWSRNRRELFFYIVPGTIMAAPIEPGPSFRAGTPQTVVKGRYLSPQTGRNYEVSPDGKRFLVIKDARSAEDTANPPQLVVVQNWLEELKRKLP
jgi:serine/threonine-protein kinase